MKKQPEKPVVVERRGRETGTLVAGSVPWQIAQLEPGASMLVLDAPNRAQQLSVAINRYTSSHGGRYTVQTCAGMPLTFDGSAFKFFRITRTE
ncbi:hypothetical protein AB4Y36_38155 [Paraburkholderia sp. BR10936]|uniref:hypothetical protein n=1 Tax=Paraburkholderia sp. BR10936 TaxID=3236993 RepID=UPI0034D25577